MRDIVAAATQAPSVHNTQPWRFVASGSGLQVWADRSRALPVLDPSGRALHLSCGAAAAFARFYAASIGLSSSAVLLPDPHVPDHLVDLRMDAAGPVPTADAALGDCIARRYTDRRPFGPQPVTEPEVTRLARAAEQEGAWLRVVRSPDEVGATVVALSRADEVLNDDPAYLEELRRWTGRRPGAPDGIPSDAVPPVRGRASSYRLRDFEPEGTTPVEPGGSDLPPPAEHPLVVVIGTLDDDPRAWLVAGGALARVLLQATLDGLGASPMTQALEVADVRARLTRELGLVGHPQMVLRIGHPAGATGATPPARSSRRPVEEVLQILE